MTTAYIAWLEAKSGIDYAIVYLGAFGVDVAMWFTIYSIFN